MARLAQSQETLPLGGIPETELMVVREPNGAGRFIIKGAACEVNPFAAPAEKEEKSFLKLTEISKMKGQGLTCASNSKLIAVNQKYITYAMKEGFVRIINQNGKDLFKLNNSTKAKIIDLVINGTGDRRDSLSTVVSVDEAARVTVFELDANPGGSTGDEKARRTELVFPTADPPLRVLGHPTDSRLFVTLHATRFCLWGLAQLEGKAGDQAAARAITTHNIVGETHPACSQGSVAGPWAAVEARNPFLLDAAISADGSCLVALAADGLSVWRLRGDAVGEEQGVRLLQRLPLESSLPARDMPCSVRLLASGSASGSRDRANSPHALVLASSSGCRLLAYKFTPEVNAPVGALAQCIQISGQDAAGRVDVNSITRDSLAIAFSDKETVLVLPLAIGWTGGSGLPLPYVQRLLTSEPAHQLTIMTGKSPGPNGCLTLFMYQARNFTREKDNLPGCNVIVNEVIPGVIAREPVDTSIPGMPSMTPGSGSPGQLGALQSREDAAIPAAAAGPEVATRDVALAASAGEAPPFADGRAAEQPELAAEPSPSPAVKHGLEVAQSAQVPAEDHGAEGERQEEPEEARDSCAPPAPRVLQRGSGGGAFAAAATAEAPPVASRAGPCAGATIAAEPPAELALGSAPDREEFGGGEGRPNLDYGFVKHMAASFVRGLEKRSTEMADKVASEVTDIVRAAQAQPSGEAGRGESGGKPAPAAAAVDLVMLEQTLAKLREARETQGSAQGASERNLAAAVRKATDAWADASATAMAGLLQKELIKISDGVAANLSQQLTSSRKFCDALARGVQRTSGLATCKALEELRPPQALQETVGAALSGAFQESLAPVFREELRSHFEQELAPLISLRVGEMMSSFKDRMTKCIEDIAEAQEQQVKRLGLVLAPVVAFELKQAEGLLLQQAARTAAPAEGTSSAGVTSAQLDDLVEAVQVEVIEPLHQRVKDLSAQVQVLRKEASDLERRLHAATGAAGAQSATPSAVVAEPKASEEEVARDLERIFRGGKVQDALVKAMHQQGQAKHVDYIGRLLALVTAPRDEWLSGGGGDASEGPLNAPHTMLLMLSLARQLENPQLTEAIQRDKIDWINELWIAFDPHDRAVIKSAASLCKQLIEALDRIPVTTAGEHLRPLKKQLSATARRLGANKCQ